MSHFQKYIDREISWLQFNERVLQEAKDPSTPLIERMRFLGIYSNNLDEFFRTRVGHLRQMRELDDGHAEYEIDPAQTLQDVYHYADYLRSDFEKTFSKLVIELAQHHIHLVDETQLDEAHRNFSIQYFRQQVRSSLFPLLLDKISDHRALNEHSIYLFVKMSRSQQPQTKSNYAIVELPTDTLSRFIILPKRGEDAYVILLDDMVRIGFPDIFLPFGYDQYEAYTFKFTRNAEVPVEVSADTIAMMRQLIHLRKESEVVRFLYDRNMPKSMLDCLMVTLRISRDADVDAGSRYHNSKDFVHFPAELGNGQHLFPPHIPNDPTDIPIHSNMLDLIRQRDRLLHFPYQSFQMAVDLLREASIDPGVRAIQMTIYRVAENSAILNALVNAARNGKEVSVYVEIKARFDEEHNLFWMEKLQQEGVKVMQILPDYKVHAKMILITPTDKRHRPQYAGIGTGNPNENTARVYTDKLLFTAHPDITSEVEKVFEMIENRLSFPQFDTLLVAPINFRSRIEHCIDFEISQAKQGLKAWLTFKLNSLTDKGMVDKLYEAAQAGVEVTLMVRVMCVLNPFCEAAAGRIYAFSIVGRFLEHSRVYAFCNASDPLYYLGSADLVRQKINKRIEVVTPIFDPRIREELQAILDLQRADNSKARMIDPANANHYVTNEFPKRHSQEDIYQYLKNRHS